MRTARVARPGRGSTDRELDRRGEQLGGIVVVPLVREKDLLRIVGNDDQEAATDVTAFFKRVLTPLFHLYSRRKERLGGIVAVPLVREKHLLRTVGNDDQNATTDVRTLLKMVDFLSIFRFFDTDFRSSLEAEGSKNELLVLASFGRGWKATTECRAKS
jgi:hypothetical protein